jgi:hypothetical protein
MKNSLLKIFATTLVIAIYLAVVPGFGEDYLVIKKRDGSTQKVPLNFPAGDIEAFDVESAKGAHREPSEPPAARTEDQESAAGEREVDEPPQQPPSAQSQPGIQPDESSTTTPFLREREPRSEQPGGPSVTPPRGPGKGPGGPRGTESPTGPATRPPSGPVAAAAPGGKGTFSVNVYKLPENVKALPEFSAFRPVKTLTADKIDLGPGTKGTGLVGLPENTDGMGLRFMGIFLVAGEGIFKWRLFSKDGARMHIDDKTLIENDGIHEPYAKTGFVHLAEGVHSVIVDSFNSKGSPVLKLSVQPPVGPEQVFSIGKGLAGWKEPAKPYDVLWAQVYFIPKGSYPRGPDFSRLSPIGRLIAPDLNITGGESFAGLPGRRDMVGMKYQGFFNVTGAGIFAFRLATDNFATLTIGKDSIIEITDGEKRGAKGKLGWAFLQEGSYPIGIDYFHARGEPRLELFVTQPLKEEELFAPSRVLAGFDADSGKMSLIPAFVYFLKKGVKRLPSFNKMSPSGMFFTKAIDYPVDRGTRTFPGVPQRENWFGLRFYVKFSLSEQEAGTYKFRVVCRDGARLILGKNRVINADGVGSVKEKTGQADLKAGSHEMFLDYFQTTGPNGLQLYITPPGGEEKIFAFN